MKNKYFCFLRYLRFHFNFLYTRDDGQKQLLERAKNRSKFMERRNIIDMDYRHYFILRENFY